MNSSRSAFGGATRARSRTAVRAFALLLGALLLGAAYAASETRALDLHAVRNVDASTVNGRIAVTVDPSATGVSIEHRGNVDYEVSVQGDTLRIRGRNRVFWCINCEVSFDVRLPGPAAVRLRTTNGSLSVSGAMERVDAATTNGNVTTRGTGDAPLDLRTTNGRVAVAGARGEVRARNTNGSVELNGVRLPAGSESSVRTVNGSVTVTGLTTTAALDISGHVSNGGIHVSLNRFDVSYPDSRSFRASTVGEGHASLELTTVNGSLSIRP